MSENTLPPFRADHVGSLLRPAALTQARADFKAGTIDADALRAARTTRSAARSSSSTTSA
jgi:5-methyltetrahydropteroyltriglutamate--homocysteine methyltransferase